MAVPCPCKELSNDMWQYPPYDLGDSPFKRNVIPENLFFVYRPLSSLHIFDCENTKGQKTCLVFCK